MQNHSPLEESVRSGRKPASEPVREAFILESFPSPHQPSPRLGFCDNPSRLGAVEKPLVGRMAFTPLTRGARGVGFQPREGERNG